MRELNSNEMLAVSGGHRTIRPITPDKRPGDVCVTIGGREICGQPLPPPPDTTPSCAPSHGGARCA